MGFTCVHKLFHWVFRPSGILGKIIMKAWKIVHVRDGKFFSYSTQNQAELLYEIGKQTIVPKWLVDLELYPLVFYSAQWLAGFIFMDYDSRYRCSIIECECEDMVTLPERLSTRELSNGELDPENKSFPTGTLSFKKVVPIKSYSIEEFFTVVFGWKPGLTHIYLSHSGFIKMDTIHDPSTLYGTRIVFDPESHDNKTQTVRFVPVESIRN